MSAFARKHKAAKTEPRIFCCMTKERKAEEKERITRSKGAPPQAAAWSYIYDHRAWPKSKETPGPSQEIVLVTAPGILELLAGQVQGEQAKKELEDSLWPGVFVITVGFSQ